MRRRHKPSLQTDDSIEEITTIIIAAAATPRTTATKRDHVASYITGKDVVYGNILKRSKKSLRLSSKISLRTAFRSE